MVTAPILTDRLVLKPIGCAQAARILTGDLGSLAAAAGWPQASTIEGLRLEAALGGSPACWLIVRAGIVIGELGWKGGPGPDGDAEIGYSLVPDYRGHGYASEAVGGFVEWARNQPEVRRLVAQTSADNIASRRVLEQSGFTVSDCKDGFFYWLRETAS